MKIFSTNQIRKSWIDFFANKGYQLIKNSSLVPENDNSLLLINSGIAALKKYFKNPSEAPSKNLVNCQDVVRTNDLENLEINSKNFYHQTLFEMLGCFSIDGNFKKETISLIWNYITSEEWLNLNKERIFITVLENDKETYNIWSELISKEKIILCSKESNFWDMGDGPCGPNTEMYYRIKESSGKGIIDIESSDFLEIVNIVFSEYNHVGNDYLKLSKKCVDVGAGLERISIAVQGVNNSFEIDIWKKSIEYLNKNFNKWPENIIRIVVDHLRMIMFCLADNIEPSKEGRGYIIKKLMKKISLICYIYSKEKEFTNKNLIETIEKIIDDNYDFYEKIKKIKENEKEKSKVFRLIVENFEKNKNSIEKGKKEIENIFLKNRNKIDEFDIFFLYDTKGVSVEIIDDFMKSKKLTFPHKKFELLVERQRSRGRLEREKKKISKFDN